MCIEIKLILAEQNSIDLTLASCGKKNISYQGDQSPSMAVAAGGGELRFVSE